MQNSITGIGVSERGIGLLGLMVIFALFGIVAAVILPALQKPEHPDTVTLHVERSSAWLCGLCDADIYVNNIRRGAIGRGDTQTFYFPAVADGLNNLQVRLVAVIGPDTESNIVQFTAGGGATAHVRMEITGPTTEGIVLRVGVEPPSQSRSTGRAMLDRLVVAATDTGPALLPWDAIYAVAAVIGAVGVIWFCVRR